MIYNEPPHEKKTTICIRWNKRRRPADQHLYSGNIDGTISILKSKISSFLPASVTVQAGLCLTWSETQIVCFLMQWLI